DIIGQWGGSMCLSGGKHYFKNVTFINLAGTYSTAVIENNADTTLEDCKFINNGYSRPMINGVLPNPHPWAGYDNVGGQVILAASGSVTAKNTQFIGNVVGGGGSINIQGASIVNLKHVQFISNTATSNPVLTTSGGWTGLLNINNATMKDNISKTIGQIVINQAGDTSKGHIAMNGLSFVNNTAITGGAMYIDWDMTVDPWDCIDCTFTNNYAEVGGAIYAITTNCFPPNMWITSKFYNNSAKYYGNIAATEPMSFAISKPTLSIPANVLSTNPSETAVNYTVNYIPTTLLSGDTLPLLEILVLDGFGQRYEQAEIGDGSNLQLSKLIMSSWHLVNQNNDSISVGGDVVQLCLHGYCVHDHLMLYGEENQTYTLRMHTINKADYRVLSNSELTFPVTFNKCPTDDGLHFIIAQSNSSKLPAICEIPQCPTPCTRGTCTPELTCVCPKYWHGETCNLRYTYVNSKSITWAFVALAAICIVLTLVCIGGLAVYRRHKEVKGASPLFLMIAAMGCLINYMQIVIYTLEAVTLTIDLCIAEFWMKVR
ncbi:hypothetical protein HK096_007373, partial [Nowakowskiella sp. JEL0078]